MGASLLPLRRRPPSPTALLGTAAVRQRPPRRGVRVLRRVRHHGLPGRPSWVFFEGGLETFYITKVG